MTLCKTCGGSFRWIEKGGKWHAVNVDGSSHWALCDGRKKKVAANAPREIAGVKITGEKYRESCGECNLPAWEVCACSHLLAA